MRPVLLIDFGSTYTKLTAVDLDAEAVLGTAASYTTVQTDINEGLTKGLALLEEKTGKLVLAVIMAISMRFNSPPERLAFISRSIYSFAHSPTSERMLQISETDILRPAASVIKSFTVSPLKCTGC